jgi:hypothetical protein
MNVIYEPSVMIQIQNAQLRADLEGMKISRIELTSKEMDELVNELGGECPRVNFCPRTVPFKQFNVVEVFNAK